MAIDLLSLKSQIISYLPRVAIAIGILIAGVVAAYIAKKIMKKFGEETVKKTKNNLDDIIFSNATTGLVYAIYGTAGMLAARELGADLLSKIILAGLVIVLAKPIAGIVKAILESFEEGVVKKTKSKADDVIFPIVNKVVISTIYILAVIVSLDQLGIKIVPLIAGMGIAGLAIGFAAKDTLSNMIAGIFIILDRPFEVGDRIEIWSAPKKSATWGDVMEIGLRTTKIRTTDNIVMIIPNSEIAKRDIINYTALAPDIRVRIPIGIAFEADLKKAEEILLKIAKRTRGVLEKPVTKVIVKGFGESSIDLELRVWIEDARIRRRITSGIGKKIKEEFDKEGIEIPYPKRHIVVKEWKKE